MLQHTVERAMFLRTLGEESLPGPLLWLHGLGESGLCFERIVAHPRLAGWRHLVPDLPGYGRSAWPREPIGLPDLATLLASWLASRDEPPAVVVGHSMGGVLGLLLADRHPSCVRALLNVDGNISLDDCRYSGKAARWVLNDFLAGGFDHFRDEVYQDGLNDPPHRGYYASLRLADPRVFHRHSQDLVALSAAGELPRRMAALPMPARYLAGEPHGASPRSRALLQAAGVPISGVTPAGHWPFLDQPDTFAHVLVGFLEADAEVWSPE
ncbi:MAG: alpha/beta hydrolase [Pseudomonadota bacterium]